MMAGKLEDWQSSGKSPNEQVEKKRLLEALKDSRQVNQ